MLFVIKYWKMITLFLNSDFALHSGVDTLLIVDKFIQYQSKMNETI